MLYKTDVFLSIFSKNKKKKEREKNQWKIYSNHLHPMQNEQELRSQSVISNSAI